MALSDSLLSGYRILYGLSPVKVGLNRLTAVLWPYLVSVDHPEPVTRRTRVGSPPFQVELDLRDRMQYLIFMRRRHEPRTERAFRDWLRPGTVFVDVGANLGYFSLLAAAADPSIRVFSFEPLPRMAEAFRRNVALNRFTNIVLEELALSDRGGSALLESSDPVHESGWNSIGLPGAEKRPHSREVLIDRLDHALEKHGSPRVDLIKIDVEGHELAVLKGARATLAAPGSRTVLIELNEPTLLAQGTSGAEVHSYLSELGYRLTFEDLELNRFYSKA